MNLADAYYFGAWNAIQEGIERGYLDETNMHFYKKRLMKIICMGDES